MPGQKKDQVKTVQNEAGGLSGRREASQGNPWPRHTPTVSLSAYERMMTKFYADMNKAVQREVRKRRQSFTRLRHRVLIVPQIHYASITKEN
jgi:hypothetical protein